MTTLPIESALPELLEALINHDQAVLEAPPGAGKTTQVPLSLKDANWLNDQKMLMLEPRRIAAKTAAARMASMLGEAVGDTVGYRVRLDTKVSGKTRIEIVTEGILVRMLQSDPSLEGYGLVIFDEFHERNMDAELGLALTLEARAIFREDDPLKLLIMSATLDGEAISDLLGNAPIIKSLGRSYPVKEVYTGAPQQNEWIETKTVKAIEQALLEQEGSILCFLPGQREIRKTAELLEERTLPQQEKVIITPLYGDLKLEQQQMAIEPAPKGQRKIVLATNIAETSLTIQGISAVVDAGLEREARYDPTTAMTRLHTCKISKASSVQRAGRAGRLGPGTCYRLWSESQQEQLVAFSQPEILQADLTSLALQLCCWGIPDPNSLAWIDAPPKGAYNQAIELLKSLEAIDEKGAATSHGEQMAQFPLHPRLSHMMIKAKELGLEKKAAAIAALLMERDPLKTNQSDIEERLDWLETTPQHNKGAWYRLDTQRKQLIRICDSLPCANLSLPNSIDSRYQAGLLLALAYPDRIAHRKPEKLSQYQLSNGRSASFREQDRLARHPWLTVANLQGRHGESSDTITLAAALDETLLARFIPDLITEAEMIDWDKQTDRLVAEQQTCIGKLVLERTPLDSPSREAIISAICQQIQKRGLHILPWSDELRDWQQRVVFLYQHDNSANQWPDLSDQWLVDNIQSWLGPYLTDVSHINHLKRLDLKSILLALLPWPLPQAMEQLAPEKYQVPSGSKKRIDYATYPPILAVKLQEMFGCDETPTIANGVSLQLHLLSPAQRPLQVTQDLVSFWENGYKEVQKDMKGRYPKHPWPDDPMTFQPTAKTKRHLNKNGA
ncbi:ATP-dependent helicase HrpB [Neptuniibacter caesariensis]|uniref:ATP-dependent helicase HrpB n=1 Tax=Neptuniibacter caesariensis TaxID=207954 RepID=A0A7U8GRA9_NEPCE|nr:ATP-dependent helicase HrpB [Neptuniibacter caesariensis]EAR60146.1 ATP-dependent helicase HrpB [Oceanospirillum sp. MED92] [Neptuniibacter caesariensis]